MKALLLLIVLLLPGTLLRAAVIYTNPGQSDNPLDDLIITNNQPVERYIDLNGDSIDDFMLRVTLEDFKIVPLLSNRLHTTLPAAPDINTFVIPHVLGSNIGSSVSEGTWFSRIDGPLGPIGGTLVSCLEGSLGPQCIGLWAGQEAYAGLEFEINGQTHYGWMRLEVGEFNGGWVRDYAYESVPGASIGAGQIPEPTTSALIVGGLVFVIGRRRRNNQGINQGAVHQGKMLRGIAYEGEVNGHDLDDFVTETSDAVLDGQNFSNHSYGINGGWEIRNIGGNNWWYWTYPAFSEDPRLGAYSDVGIGDTSSEALDDFVHTAEVHLPVYAAGNPNNYGPGSAVNHAIIIGGSYDSSTATRDWTNGDDSYDTVISPATAKNVLTVGSITDIDFSAGSFRISGFTGTGPTDDGRIKPDLVAVGQRNSSFGYGNSLFAAHKTSNGSYYNGILADSNGNVNLQGTSFAAPNVTGGLILAEQRRVQLLPSASPLLASTWRAASVHTALELGSPGPSYLTGWGSFDTERLVSLLEDDESAGRGTLIKEFTISTGVPKTFYVTLPANTQGDITLAWSDPAGSPASFGSVVDDSTAMLVNDIDLVAVDAVTSTPHLPWVLDPDFLGESAAVRGAAATRGTDDRNNLEKVTIDTDTQERRLAVTITPNGTLQGGSQKVSLILSGVVPEAPQVVSSGFTQNPSNLDEYAVTFRSDPGAFYTLETSTTLQSGSWSDVSTFKADDSTTTVLTTRDTGSTKQFWRVRRGE